MITVYGQPGCQPCKATTDYLRRREVAYAYRDVSLDKGAMNLLAEMGYMATPVVTVGDMHWTGFRPTKLDQAIELLSEQDHPADDEATAYLMGE